MAKTRKRRFNGIDSSGLPGAVTREDKGQQVTFEFGDDDPKAPHGIMTLLRGTPMIVWPGPTKKAWQVAQISVKPQRKGYGTKFYELAAEAARDEGVELLCSDFRRFDPAEGFWQKQIRKGRVTETYRGWRGVGEVYCLDVPKEGKIDLGRMETSDWERGPDEMDFSDEERRKQDKATGWVMALGAGLLLLVVVKKSS